MNDKDKQLMIELIMQNGKAGLMLFAFNREEREEFLRKYGLWDKTEKSCSLRDTSAWTSDHLESERLKAEAMLLEREIVRDCKEQLKVNGVDIETVFGPERSWEEIREEIAVQLESLGIDRQTAYRAGMLDPDNITLGVDHTFVLNDTPEQRQKLKKEGFEFTARDGHIVLNTLVMGRQGVSFEDTRKNRHLLDELELDYITLAQGHDLRAGRRSALFVPFNWVNRIEGCTLNTRLAQKTEQLALLVAAGLLGGPALGIIVYFAIANTHWRNDLFRKHELNLGQRNAVERGLTAYKEVHDRNGKLHGTFYYKENGQLYSIAANEVRIPVQVNGVKLSPLQIDQLRRGELIMLQDRKGQEFGVRVDLSNTDGIRQYYRAMRSDSKMTPKPGPGSDDREQLEWIARFGAVGVGDIYGQSNVNLRRDAFLSRYGLKDAYRAWRSAELQVKEGGTPDRRARAEQEMDHNDTILREKAVSETEKQHRGRGL